MKTLTWKLNYVMGSIVYASFYNINHSKMVKIFDIFWILVFSSLSSLYFWCLYHILFLFNYFILFCLYHILTIKLSLNFKYSHKFSIHIWRTLLTLICLEEMMNVKVNQLHRWYFVDQHFKVTQNSN